jgi:hypothetical protein
MPTDDTGTKMDLAERLRLTRRRVDQLIDAGMFYARVDGAFDITANAERYRAYRRKDVDWIAEELERLAGQISAGLKQMRATSSRPKRRKVAREIGPLIPALDAAMRVGNAISPLGHRDLLNQYTTTLTNGLIDEVLAELPELTTTGKKDE